MKISRSNYRLFAAKHYDNPFCLNESEFDSDLYKVSVIKKIITGYENNEGVNIKLLVNSTISFFNVFDHHAAKEILQFKLPEKQYQYLNAVLLFLYLPLVEPEDSINTNFYKEITKVFQ